MGPLIWFVLALLFGVIELLSMTLILLWVAVAALATAVLSFGAHSFAVQMSMFVVLSIILLIATRPLVRRWRGASTASFKSNIQQMTGQEGVITTPIKGGRTGVVRVNGETWSARGHSPDDTFVQGERVVVLAVKSSLLIVGKWLDGDPAHHVAL